MATILAASVPDKTVSIILTCLMLMAAFLVLGVGLWYIRRWQRGVRTNSSTPWSFDDLRKLRDEGQLTEAEYQTLRAAMVGRYTGELNPDGSRSPSPDHAKQKGDETWDWVAEDDPGSGGFDVKKQSPD